MKVSERLESRIKTWKELEGSIAWLSGWRHASDPQRLSRFAALYRSACADLALADAYQLPPKTVQYLHDLVGRAHNQLYRSQRFNFRAWGHELFRVLPGRLARDRCLWLAMALFWGTFLVSMALGRYSPEFADRLVGKEQLEAMSEMHAKSVSGRDANQGLGMAGFYIQHNTSIGLECFVGGVLLGVAGIFTTVFNAALLGTVFGYMTRSPSAANFFQFVTAHGPFELTAIVVSAAAGMRLGFALINTGGLARLEALRLSGRRAMPIMGVAIALFALAALIEAFLSPSTAPYEVKAFVAALSTAMLLFYVFGLGLSRSADPEEAVEDPRATG